MVEQAVAAERSTSKANWLTKQDASAKNLQQAHHMLLEVRGEDKESSTEAGENEGRSGLCKPAQNLSWVADL